MAVLSETDRVDIWARVMRDDSISITKSELRAAVDAIDDFLDTNATALNSALPQPARSTLTTGQKARLLAYVALKRWGG